MAIADKVVVELELRDGQYLSRVRMNERVFSESVRKTEASARASATGIVTAEQRIERAFAQTSAAKNRAAITQLRLDREISRSAQVTERQVRSSSSSISSALKGAAGTIAATVGVRAITGLADSYTRLQNSFKVAGLSGSSLVSVQNQLFEIANRNGVAVAELGQLYSRVALNNQALGASQSELITVTEAAAAALKVQGLSATAARGPLLQLAQTLGSDIARAEEYNSVIEGIPVLAQAVASGLGVTTAELGKLVREGNVTTQDYFRALLKGSDDLIEKSKTVQLTIGGAFEVLNNELGRYVGQTDDSLNATERLAGGIKLLADNLETVVPAIAAIGGLFGTRYAAGLITASLAQDGFITKGRQAVAAAIEDERIKTAAVAAGTRARTAAYTAESIALRAQVDTGRNAAGQFVSRARSAEALAVANRNLAASIGPATVATVRNTAAVRGAVTGAKALGSGLSALAGGPLGLTVLAIAAVTFALVKLNETYGRAGIAARELSVVTERSERFLARYEKAQYDAATATGENAKAARDHVEALKAEGREIINVARLNAQRRIQEAGQERREADRALAQLGDRRSGQGSRSFSNASIIQDQAAQRTAQTAINQAVDARKDANEALNALNELTRAVNGPAPGIGGGGGGGGSVAAGGGSGGSASSRANDAADRLDELRADLARIQEAQLSDAERSAKELAETIAVITRARDEGLIQGAEVERLTAGAYGTDIKAPTITSLDAIDTRAIQELGKDIAEGIAAERQVFLDQGAATARGFLDIVAADDPGRALGEAFRSAAFDNLEQALSSIFSSLFQQNAAGGGNIGSTIAGFFGFGGGRASGGPVRAGFSYDVGESGREKFVAPANGYIIPNMGAQARSATSQRIEVKQTFSFEGTTGDAALDARMRMYVAQGQRQTLAAVQQLAPGVQREQRLLRE